MGLQTPFHLCRRHRKTFHQLLWQFRDMPPVFYKEDYDFFNDDYTQSVHGCPIHPSQKHTIHVLHN
jgi:hypothetical protein